MNDVAWREEQEGLRIERMWFTAKMPTFPGITNSGFILKCLDP